MKVSFRPKTLFIISFLAVIVSEIVNGSRYSAEFKYVYIPILICMVISLFCQSKKFDFSRYSFLFVLVLYTAAVTLLSTVVSFHLSDIGFYVLLLMLILVTSIEFDSHDINAIMTLYILVSCVFAIMIIINYVNNSGTSYFRGSLNIFNYIKDQNYLSAFLCPGAVLALLKFFLSRKKMFLVMAVVIFTGIFLTGSRGGFLSCFIAMALLALFFFNKFSFYKKVLLIVGIAIVAFAFIRIFDSFDLFGRMTGIEAYSDNVRLEIWKGALSGFYNKPVLGNGLFSSSYYSRIASGAETHNCFLDILIDQGIIGMLIHVVMFVKMMKVRKDNTLPYLAIVIAFFFPLFFINGYFTINFWIPVMICWIISDFCKLNSIRDLYNDSLVTG